MTPLYDAYFDLSSPEEEFKIIEEDTLKKQTMEPDNIDDDGKRDEYLSNY